MNRHFNIMEMSSSIIVRTIKLLEKNEPTRLSSSYLLDNDFDPLGPHVIAKHYKKEYIQR